MDEKFKVTVHKSAQGGFMLSIETSGHVTLSTHDYNHQPGSHVDVTFYNLSPNDIAALRSKMPIVALGPQAEEK